MHYVHKFLSIAASSNMREPMENLEGMARRLLEEVEPGMSIRFHCRNKGVVYGRIECIAATGMTLGRKGGEVYVPYSEVQSYDIL